MPSRKLTFAMALAVLLAATETSFGEICTLDNRPAATLLLPYFEVDLEDPAGPNTHFTLVNAAQVGNLAQVVLWSELGIPVYAFPLFLPGYGQVSVDLRTVVRTGVYPKTQVSRTARIRFTNCPAELTGFSGPHMPPLSDPALIAPLLRGEPVASRGRRAARPRGDLVRGYVTIDAMRNCTTWIPVVDPLYFVMTTTENVLWGTFFYVDLRAGRQMAQGARLIGLEANRNDPRLTESPKHTFYSALHGSPVDFREPLGSTYRLHYLSGPGFETEIIYWRDSGAKPQLVEPPATTAPWGPLEQFEITIVDDQRVAHSLPNPDFVPFPVMSGKTALVHLPTGRFPTTALEELEVPTSSGWLHLNLNRVEDSTAIRAQAWVGVLYRAGNMSALLETLQLDSMCSPNRQPLPLPPQPSTVDH